MSTCFRNAVFTLCKKLSNNNVALNVRSTIHDMSVVITTDEDDPKVWKRPPHGDLAQIAAHHRLQFMGYLLADESVEDINKTQPFQATHLNENERKILEAAHKALLLFVSECIRDIKDKYPKAYLLIDPYSLYRSPQNKTEAESFLTRQDLKDCANAFKSGRVYKKLFENDTLQILESTDENVIRQLSAIQQKQFGEDFSVLSNETSGFIKRIQSNAEITLPDLLMISSTYCYALKKSLMNALQMLYDAIVGHDMLVMDNENIISIETREKGSIYEKNAVLIQGATWGNRGGDVGSIVLLTCNPSEFDQIKDFGIVFSLTVSFIGEFGDTSKITMVTVDEELNEIHTLTDTILSSKIGSVPVKYQNDLNSNTGRKM